MPETSRVTSTIAAIPYRCAAHGNCAAVDEELFPLDEDGFTAIDERGRQVPPEKMDAARQAVAACPMLALYFVEDSSERAAGTANDK